MVSQLSALVKTALDEHTWLLLLILSRSFLLLLSSSLSQSPLASILYQNIQEQTLQRRVPEKSNKCHT